MSGRDVNVTIRAKDDTKAAFDTASQNAKSFGSGISSALNPLTLMKTAIAGLGIAALGGFFKAAVSSAADADAAWGRAASALENAGLSARAARPEVDALATSIQKSTRFSDDAATGAFATLLSISKDYTGSLKNVHLAADIAVAKHIELDQAAKLVGKAMIGETSSLKKFGIVVNENGDAMTQLQERFNGFSTRDGATLQGRLEQIKNAWDNVLEATGRAVTGTDKTTDATNVLVGALNDFGKWIDENSDDIKGMIDDVVTLTARVGDLARGLIKLTSVGDSSGSFFKDGIFESKQSIAAGVEAPGDVNYYKALGRIQARQARELAAAASKAAKEGRAGKHAKDAATAEAEERKRQAALREEIGQLSKAKELGTLRVADLRRLIELEQQLASVMSGRGSLADRNAAATGLAQLQAGNPLGKAIGLATTPGKNSPSPMANVSGIPGLTDPGAANVHVGIGQDIAHSFDAARDAIFGADAAVRTMGESIGNVGASALSNFADTWLEATDSIASGAQSVGNAMVGSARKAVAGAASAEASLTALDAAKALAKGFTNPVELLKAGRLFAVASGYRLLAGALGGGGGGGSVTGGGGGASAASFDQGRDSLRDAQGTLTVRWPGKAKSALDVSDPDDQDAIVEMLKKLAGNRQINIEFDGA